MKTKSIFSALCRDAFLLASLLGIPCLAGEPVPALLDGFDQTMTTALGTPRLPIDDSSIGGQSQVALDCADGVLTATGRIAPARGQPGFVSLVLLLSPDGSRQSLAGYEGIRLRLKITAGVVSVIAASDEIENFDFHAKVIARTGGEFREVRIPFADLKRVWSPQTDLNLESITSINLVASGIQPGEFAYAVDEIGFY